MDLAQRMAAVEEALTLQLKVGTSHLQAIEMAPEKFGITNQARPGIKQIRKRRNWALHSVTKLNGSEAGDELIARKVTGKREIASQTQPRLRGD